MNFKIIDNTKVDAAKWDICVAKHQAAIYCKNIYLNAMAKNWVAIIVNDYEAIMPICIHKKFGIKYSYTPAFVQQLGFIGAIEIDCNELQKMVFEIVKYGDINFNHNNLFANIIAQQKTNFIIGLNASYEVIYNNYKHDLKQNLKKAAKQNLLYTSSNNINAAIEQYQKMYSNRIEIFTNNDYTNFTSLCLNLATSNNCIVRQITNTNNQVLATALLLIDNNRIYNIANSTTSLGRSTEANHFLMDSILKEFANSNLIFDFEGSDLLGVKSFYKKFGAVDEPYFHWHFNNLPWWIRLIKK